MTFLTPETLPDEYICRTLRIPNDSYWLSLVNGVLAELIKVYNFEQLSVTDVTPQQTVEVFQEMFLDYLNGAPCMIGAVILYATNAAPDGTLPCDGSTFLRVDYPKLYDVLSPIYKPDVDHFTTPAHPSFVGLNWRIVAR